MTYFDLATSRELLHMKAPFRISGRVFDTIPVLMVKLAADGRRGRGEAAGVYYTDDNPESMQLAVEKVRDAIEHGITREALRDLLPPGGARNAVDCALWEFEAALQHTTVGRMAGVDSPRSLLTTLTLGADVPEAMARAATELKNAKALKLKLTGDIVEDIARLRAVRAARPDAWLSLDANQGYTPLSIKPLLPELVRNRVQLLEQPFARGCEEDMETVEFPVPTAADESCLNLDELELAAHYFDAVNIKLDKCGGLTEGLLMCAKAKSLGLKTMVGNMGGSSLAMAPALVLAQQCDLVDLDGAFFLRRDRVPALRYVDGYIVDPGGVWGDGVHDAPASAQDGGAGS